MATPRNNAYAVASGGGVFAGRPGLTPMSWAAGQAAVCCLGNSLMAGVGGTPPSVYLPGQSPVSIGPSPVANVSVSSATAADLLGSVSAVTAAYVAGRTNVLIVWEITNSVQTGRTAQQAVDDLFALAAACKAQRPWKVAVATAIPRYQWLDAVGGPVSDAKSAALNAVLDSANSLLRAQFRANGCDLLLEMRRAGSPFALAAYNSANFAAVQDASGNFLYLNESGSYVHLINFGYLEVAKVMAPQLAAMPA